MTKKELEDFIIEATCISFEGEARNFCDYFKVDYINVTYEIKDGKGYIYFNDHDEKTLVKEFDYKGAICAWKWGIKELGNMYDAVIEKYKLVGGEDNA